MATKKLATYRAKRDFSKTREPSGREKVKEKIVSTKEMGELVCDYIRMPDAT